MISKPTTFLQFLKPSGKKDQVRLKTITVTTSFFESLFSHMIEPKKNPLTVGGQNLKQQER